MQIGILCQKWHSDGFATVGAVGVEGWHRGPLPSTRTTRSLYHLPGLPFMIYLAAYLGLGLLVAEVCRYVFQKYSGPVSTSQYLILVFLWPVCIFIASRRW